MDSPQQTLSPLFYLKQLWYRKVACILIVGCITGLALLYSMIAPKAYRSRVVFLPLQQSSATSTSSIASALNIVPFLAGSGAIARAETKFIILLQSQSFLLHVVESMNLWSEEMKPLEAIERLRGVVKIEQDLSYPEMITIAVELGDRELTTKIAKQYIVELQNFISNRSLTSAKRYRLYLEDQMAKMKRELLEVGKAVANFYGENPVSEIKGKLNVPIALNTKEGTRNFKSYEEFRQRFKEIQVAPSDEKLGQEVETVRDVPHQVYLKYLTTQQIVFEENYLALTRSHQIAKMEEAKEEPSFQILEEPAVPKHHFRPQRRKIVTTAFLLSLLPAILYGLVGRNGWKLVQSYFSSLK